MPPVLSEDDKDQRLRERSKEVLRLLVQTQTVTFPARFAEEVPSAPAWTTSLMIKNSGIYQVLPWLAEHKLVNKNPIFKGFVYYQFQCDAEEKVDEQLDDTANILEAGRIILELLKVDVNERKSAFERAPKGTVATAGKIQDLEEKLSKKQTAMIKINELRGELERAKQLLASLTRELNSNMGEAKKRLGVDTSTLWTLFRLDSTFTRDFEKRTRLQPHSSNDGGTRTRKRARIAEDEDVKMEEDDGGILDAMKVDDT